MRIDLLSLFPEYFDSPLKSSILGRALRHKQVDVRLHQLRDYTLDRRGRVDDRSLGGGPGMVLMPQPLDAALNAVKSDASRVIYLSPQGTLFDRHKAAELARCPHLVLICGHYEGIDQRVIDAHVDEQISVGDFVLTNGCLAALLLLDATVRFIPGVLGDEASREQDSFEGPMLDHPHYTLPRVYQQRAVPAVLTGGDHAAIERWRGSAAQEATWRQRPDLSAHWVEQVCAQPSTLTSGGVLLATAQLKIWRKLLRKEMGLPWIDKSATMGALLLKREPILLWELADQGTETSLAHCQSVVHASYQMVRRATEVARRLADQYGSIRIQRGSDWVSLQDPIGWRLMITQQQEEREL